MVVKILLVLFAQREDANAALILLQFLTFKGNANAMKLFGG